MAEPLILAYGRGELPGVPGGRGHHRRHRPGRPRRRGDRGGARAPARARRAGVLPRRLGRPQPADVPQAPPERPRLLRRAPVRGRTTAARSGCRTGGSPARRASSGCSRRARRRTRSPTTSSGTRPAASAPATWPASSTSRGGGWSSCAATSTSTASTPRRSCGSTTRTRSRSSTSLDEDDRERFAFDTAVVDWDHYLREVHCPAVTEPIRAARQGAPRRGARRRPKASRVSTDSARAAPTPSGKVAAFFDMDGTLLSSNVIETYLWMRLQDLSAAERASRDRPDRGPAARAGRGPSAGSAARSCARSTASTKAPG